MNLIPAVKDFWSALRGKRGPWDRISAQQIDQQLFSAQTTLNQWSAKVQACSREEVQRKRQAAAATGPHRKLLCTQALGVRRRAQVASRVAQAMLGVIETLEQMKVNREAYDALKSAGSAELPRVVAQLEASRDALGQKLIEVESIPSAYDVPSAGLDAPTPELDEIMREVEAIETMKAEGKTDSEIDTALEGHSEEA